MSTEETQLVLSPEALAGLTDEDRARLTEGGGAALARATADTQVEVAREAMGPQDLLRTRREMQEHWDRMTDAEKARLAEHVASGDAFDRWTPEEEKAIAREVFALARPEEVRDNKPPRCFCGVHATLTHDHVGF